MKKCMVEFGDDSCMELKEDSLRILLEKGLDSFGHLKGRRVRRVLLQDE